MTKYSCPENYDWTGASLDQLYANCVNPQAGVEFLIGGPATTLIQTTDDNGQAIWTLDPGDYQLSETLPSGYIATRAFVDSISNMVAVWRRCRCHNRHSPFPCHKRETCSIASSSTWLARSTPVHRH
ncbi:MAG: prealbumin-like fold domain-containing protein [Thermomicrobiales bacterium]